MCKQPCVDQTPCFGQQAFSFLGGGRTDGTRNLCLPFHADFQLTTAGRVEWIFQTHFFYPLRRNKFSLLWVLLLFTDYFYFLFFFKFQRHHDLCLRFFSILVSAKVQVLLTSSETILHTIHLGQHLQLNCFHLLTSVAPNVSTQLFLQGIQSCNVKTSILRTQNHLS